jgi:hypothetical protein
MSHAPTDEELRWKAKKEQDEAAAEELRLKRIQTRDKLIGEHHNKMNRLLLGSQP